MARDHYHIFGLGLGTDDLRWVGWTHRSLTEEQAQILSDLLAHGDRDIANWVTDAVDRGTVSMFEIESASSREEARDQAISLCRYFESLGLTVQAPAVHVAARERSGSQAVLA
jgi:hypothetical protein